MYRLAFLLCAACTALDLAEVEQAVTGTYLFIPKSPSNNAAPTLKVSNAGSFTWVTLYKAYNCAGASAGMQWSGSAGVATFSSIAVTPNASTPMSVKLGSVCDINLRYVHDNIAPQPPTFARLEPAAPNATLTGNAEPSASVQLYKDAGCTFPYLAPVTATLTGTFTVTLPAAQPATTLRAIATDAAGNKSACSSSWTAWSPLHAAECPALAPDVPVSRAPVYAYLEFADHLFPWADECGQDRASCPDGGPTDQYFDYLETMKPALVQTQGGSPASLPMHWSMGAVGEKAVSPLTPWDCKTLYDYGPNGTPYAVFGATNFQCGIPHYFEIPFATPAQITERMAALPKYVDEFGDVEWAPYTDLDTALLGDHEARIGFWKFWDDDYDKFVAAGMLAPKSSDPNHWLLRKPMAVANPDYPSWDDLSFMYGHTKPEYEPHHRYAVNPIHPGFVEWRKQVFGLYGKAGIDRVFIDNAFGVRCWNDECAAEFPTWAATKVPNADSLLRRPPLSMISDAGFEVWARALVPPYTWNGGNPWPYGSATNGTLEPTTDAHSGMYAGAFTANAAGARLQFNTLSNGLTPNTPAGCNEMSNYNLSFYYKSNVELTVKLYDDFYNPFILATLPPASTWTKTPSGFTEDFIFGTTPADHQFALYIEAKDPGIFIIDDVELVPGSGAAQTCVAQPTSEILHAGLLATGGEGWYDPARGQLTNDYWASLVDRALNVNVTAARQANPDFDVLVNSGGVQYPSADWSMTEARRTSEHQSLMWDQGLQPGRYPAGYAFPDPRFVNGTITLASDTILANVFTGRVIGARRLPTPFAQILVTRQAEANTGGHNADTVLLQMAEDAAFVGGAGTDPDLVAHYYYYPAAVLAAATERVREFFEFTRANLDLFSCLRYAAEVGVVQRAEAVMDPSTSATPKTIRLFESLAAAGLTVDVVGEPTITAAGLGRLKVLVLDHTHRLAESEAQAINAWVLAGGRVITTSDTGLRDELGRNRDSMPTTSWTVPAPTATFVPGQIWTVPAADITVQHVLTAMTTPARPNPSAFPGLTPANAAKLRLAVWSGWNALVVHLINYDVPRGINNGNQVAPVANLQVTIPIPADAPTQNPTTAELRTPEGATQTVAVTVSNGFATFTVPSLRVYTIATLH